MFSKLKALLMGEVTSIETILVGYYKAVQQLEQHAAEQLTAAAKHAEAVVFYTRIASEAEAAEVEAKAIAAKAISVADKIKAVVA